MKKVILLLLLSLQLYFLSSCTINDYGEFELTWLFWFLLVAFIIMIVVVGIAGNKQREKLQEVLKQEGFSENDFTKTGSYVGGHPDCDKTIISTCSYLKHGELVFCDRPNELQFPYPRFKIAIEKIKNISIEDSSSIEKKITLGRVLLVGVFALAWRKNKKNEMAFVTIDWADGKFEHSTIFSFEGKDAMQAANTARNKLIKIAR